MKTKTVLFPTIFAILMAISSIGFPIPGSTYGTPWMTAIHSQTMPDNQTYGVDNIAFYLWGHQYTVVGKTIQSAFKPYDWRDFPFYSMWAIIIAVICGVLAIIVSRSAIITIKGKEIRLNRNINPLILLMMSTFLTAFAVIYLYTAAEKTIVPTLQSNNYIAEYSYGIKFMAVSVVAFLTSVVMTYINSLDKSKRIDSGKLETDSDKLEANKSGILEEISQKE